MLDKDLYRTVLENLPTGVYVVDRDRRILFWNDGAEQITGYRRHEVIGRHCQDDLLMHCNSADHVLCGDGCPLAATMHDGQPRESDLLLRHRSGERVPVRVRANPLRDENGVIIGALECFDEPIDPSEPPGHPPLPVGEDPDELTGLPKRAETEQRIKECLKECTAGRISFAVLVFAIDSLDEFQHAFGRQAAEALIRSIAHTLARNLHPGDAIGRWSDNRFVAVLRDCPDPGAHAAANGLKRIAGLAAISWWGDHLSSTISTGGSVAHPHDSVTSLLDRAFEALESCLHEGGGIAFK